jgi:hypothetical protein
MKTKNKAFHHHAMSRALVISALTLLTASFTNPVSAAIIYHETFATDVDSVGFAATYGGFTTTASSNNMSNVNVTSGVLNWTGGGDGNYNIYRTMPSAWDWSQPLTISADLGSLNSGGGQSYGVYLAASAGSSNGLTFSVFWPSATNGGAVADANFGSRIGGNQNVNPDVTASSSILYNFSLTVRENATNSTQFDVLAKIDGTEQFGGWIVGNSKASYGINNANPFGVFGIRADGLNTTNYVDNLTLSVIPEPASALLGSLGLVLLLRRRR